MRETPSELNLNLASLESGQIATIDLLEAEPGLYHRLKALGFHRGRQVLMLRRAWLSGPLHVRIGTTEVMLRRREARGVRVTNITAAKTR